MTFHPDKCSTLRISRSKNPHSKTYILKGHALATEDSTRYLGNGNAVQYVMEQAHRPDHQERKQHVILFAEKFKSQLRRNEDCCIPRPCMTRTGVLLLSLEPIHPRLHQ